VHFSRAGQSLLLAGGAIAGCVLLSKPLAGILAAAVRFDQQINLRTAVDSPQSIDRGL
jgi:hypothetical protein